MPRTNGAVATQKLLVRILYIQALMTVKSATIIDDDDENQFAKGQSTRDLPVRSDAKGDLAQTKSGRAGDLKIMNLVMLINSAQMFFRNLGFRHVNAALSLAIGLTAPNAGQKIIARFARPVEWLRSRLRPQVPEKSIDAQIQSPLEVCAAVSFPPTTDCCAGHRI